MKNISRYLAIALVFITAPCILGLSAAFAENPPSLSKVTPPGSADYDMLKSGMFMNFGLNVPVKSDLTFGVGFELGNQFTLAKFTKSVLGLRINWFSLSYSGGDQWYYDEYYTDYYNLELLQNKLKIGPSYTFKLGKNMAVDGYYQTAVTMAFDFNYSDFFLGLTHSVGGTFRYRQFASGLEVNFGNINYPDNLFDSYGAINITNLRLYVGFKF
jgi:hypothetical protein